MGYLPSTYCPLLLPPPIPDPGDGGDSGDTGDTGGTGGSGDGGDTGDTTYAYDTYLDNFEVEEHPIDGIEITVRDVPAGEEERLLSLLMINGGMLWHFPDDSTASLPNGDPITIPTLALQLTPIDYDFMKAGLPDGIRPPAWWILEGFDTGLFPDTAADLISGVAEPAKQKIWDESPPSDTSITLDQHYQNRLVAGEVALAIQAGTKIGDLASAGADGYKLLVRAFDTNGLEVHAAMLLANLGDLNGDLIDHPIAVKAGQISTPIEMYLQFRYWDVNDTTATPKGSWNMLSGATVQVIDDDYNPDDVLLVGTTDSDGKISFNVPRASFDGNDFYFQVSPAADLPVQYGSTETWRDTWSTKGWKSVNGEPGYYENFSGYSIGSPDAPILFNVGIPIFLQLRYMQQKKTQPTPGVYVSIPLTERPLAKGTVVHLLNYTPTTGGDIELQEIPLAVDEDGEIWGTGFDLLPEQSISIDLPLQLEDPSISLPLLKIARPEDVLAEGHDWLLPLTVDPWSSKDDPANGFVGEFFSGSSIGEPVAGKLQRIAVDANHEFQAAGLYILKVIRDAHQWYYHLSGGAWSGVPNLAIYFNDVWPTGSSVTPPDWGILYDKNHIWSRATIAHEYAHAVTWEYLNYTTHGLLWGTIVGYFGPSDGAYISAHWFYKITNGLTAFMDGWSLIIELAFGHPVNWAIRSPTGVVQLEDFNGNSVFINSSPQLGLECEGCYAQAFWDYLNGQGIQTTPDTDDADLLVANPSLANTANQVIFQQAIWQPMIALGNEANRADPAYVTVEDFVNQAQALMFPNDYANLQTHLTNWNL